MSARQVSDRKRRVFEQRVGEPVAFVVAETSLLIGVTPDDRHIMWHRGRDEVKVDLTPIHYTGCADLAG